MVIRMLNFEADPQHKAAALEAIDNILPKIKSLDGCENVMFLTHEDQKYSLLVFWNSREQAEAAAGTIGPQLLPVLGKFAKGPVTPVLYDVYQSAN